MDILSISDTAALVASIGRRAKSVQADIHQAACSTLSHIMEHGDFTLAVRLMNILPSGQRVKGLALWYKHFSGGKFTLRKDKKAGGWVGSLSKDRSSEDFDLSGAIETSFADFSEEKEPQSMTVDKLVKYLKKLAESTETLPNGEPKVQPEAVALAQKLVAVAA